MNGFSRRAGVTSFYVDLLQPSTSHCCAYLPVKRLCLVAPPPHYFKQSRLCTDMRTYENTCIDYILWAESLYVRVELQCFLYIKNCPRVSMQQPSSARPRQDCPSLQISRALCKLKARGSFEYFVRCPRKHLEVPQGANSGSLTVAFRRIPEAL